METVCGCMELHLPFDLINHGQNRFPFSALPCMGWIQFSRGFDLYHWKLSGHTEYKFNRVAQMTNIIYLVAFGRWRCECILLSHGGIGVAWCSL